MAEPSFPRTAGPTIYTAAVRDFAGLNYGFIDSAVENPDNLQTTTYKEASATLWGTTNILTGAMNPRASLLRPASNLAFLQPVGGSHLELSGGTVYGFGYDDTFNIVQHGPEGTSEARDHAAPGHLFLRSAGLICDDAYRERGLPPWRSACAASARPGEVRQITEPTRKARAKRVGRSKHSGLAGRSGFPFFNGSGAERPKDAD